jgi:hypothetical protein
MRSLVLELIKKSIPLGDEIASGRANCFNAVELYHGHSDKVQFTGAESFVSYLFTKFMQINSQETSVVGDVSVVWSRTSDFLPIGKIDIGHLVERRSGYPFGLVIEHAFVSRDADLVFQKRDPSALGRYEIISMRNALEPYQKSDGLEITRHRLIEYKI